MAQRLWHHDQRRGLPPRQPERTGRFALPARDRLQSAPDDLGLVGAGEQRDADQRAHQTVDGEAGRHEQWQHIGCEKQHRNQRHPAPELDEGNRENPDQRNGRASAERERDADWHRRHNAGHRHHQRHQQAAPKPGIDDRKSTAVETHQRNNDADTGEN